MALFLNQQLLCLKRYRRVINLHEFDDTDLG